MSNCRNPAPFCGSAAPALDTGTLVRWWSPAPAQACTPPPPKQWHNYSSPAGFVASTLTMSPEAVALLKGIEQLRLKPYDDQTRKAITKWVKGATIGYGHLISTKQWETYKDGITEPMATALFNSDVAPFEETVGKTIKTGVQQYEYDAMVILAFNIGQTAFQNSTVAQLINHPDLQKTEGPLEKAWKSFRISQGKINKGLINRRAAEWVIYTQAIYARW